MKLTKIFIIVLLLCLCSNLFATNPLEAISKEDACKMRDGYHEQKNLQIHHPREGEKGVNVSNIDFRKIGEKLIYGVELNIWKGENYENYSEVYTYFCKKGISEKLFPGTKELRGLWSIKGFSVKNHELIINSPYGSFIYNLENKVRDPFSYDNIKDPKKIIEIFEYKLFKRKMPDWEKGFQQVSLTDNSNNLWVEKWFFWKSGVPNSANEIHIRIYELDRKTKEITRQVPMKEYCKPLDYNKSWTYYDCPNPQR